MSESEPQKVILITGCSSGFGLLTAARLAQKGHIVYATMRNLAKKQDLLDEAIKRGTHLEILPLDVTDVDSIQKAVNLIQSKHERIDVLLNNAGYGIGGSFEDLTQDDIRAQMETNFFGVQNVTREVIPLMRKRKEGRIITVSSIAGTYALPGFGAYSASKWAVEAFSESLYYELRPFGISVCLVEPGSYRTKIFFENKRYAKNFSNTNSPYYKYSKHLSEKVDESVQQDKKDPEEVAVLIEKIIGQKNPAFRNIPDFRSKILVTLRRFLPFRVFSQILYQAILSGIEKKGE